MHLSGNERKKLRQAIISAYRSEADLQIMVDDELEENLNAIAGGGNLTQIVFSLIQWAESRGKLQQLILAAYETNSGNPDLKQFYQSIFEQKFIVQPLVNTTNNFGPDINWLGNTEQLQLQGFFQPEPDF